MAKASTSQPTPQPEPAAQQPDTVSATPVPSCSLCDIRAWELFSRNVNVTGTPTVTHEHLAEQCRLAAQAFESALNPQPKG